MTSNNYQPKPEHKFSFGLWTVGNRGRDPFGDATRPSLPPIKIVKELSRLGAYGVNLHDNDLVPIDATPQERDRIVGEFKQALADHGMKVPMATTNLFYDPVFKDGAFTSSDPRVRLYALQKTMRSMDLGAELGAHIYVFWGGREGAEVDAAKDPREALKWNREALNFLCEYSIDQGYDYKFALEAKPNEPRGDIYLPTTGAMLGFIATLDHPEIQSLLSAIHSAPAEDGMPVGSYTRAKADEIKSLSMDRIELAKKVLPYERLDQLTVDILLGVR